MLPFCSTTRSWAKWSSDSPSCCPCFESCDKHFSSESRRWCVVLLAPMSLRF
jgi:hypothetical protein